jgi:hypothetical protein
MSANTNLKLACFHARPPLSAAALFSMSLIPQLHSGIHTKWPNNSLKPYAIRDNSCNQCFRRNRRVRD